MQEACLYQDEKLLQFISERLTSQAMMPVYISPSKPRMVDVPLGALLGPHGPHIVSELAKDVDKAGRKSIKVEIFI